MRAEARRADQDADQDEADDRADPDSREGRDDDPRRAEDDERVAEAGGAEIGVRHLAFMQQSARLSAPWRSETTDLLIAGGGPAGMMAGLLFARAGVKTLVLEKHDDFLRDFRGDTVHPSTLQIFHELGMLDELLARPHDKAAQLSGIIGGEKVRIADFSHLPPPARFIALMPQWEFLDCVADLARAYPAFELRMNAEATDLVWDGERVAGVICDGAPIRAKLVIAADGRRSLLRERAAACRSRISARRSTCSGSACRRSGRPTIGSTGVIATGRLLALLDRGDYWQCAYVFAKGMADALREKGLDNFRADVAATAPVPGRRSSIAELGPGQAADGGARPADDAGTGPACSRSATPPTPCRRSAASASTSPSRTRSRRRTSSPGRWPTGSDVDDLLLAGSSAGGCCRPGSSRRCSAPPRTA